MTENEEQSGLGRHIFYRAYFLRLVSAIKRGLVNLLVYFSSQKIKRIESALDRYPQFFGEKLESELIGYFISKA